MYPYIRMDPESLISESQNLIDRLKKTTKTSTRTGNKEFIQKQKDDALDVITSDSVPLNTSFRPTTLTEHKAGKIFGFKVLDKNDIVAFVESHYIRYHHLPNKPDFIDHFKQTSYLLPQSHDGWEELLVEIEPALKARGVPTYDTPTNLLEPNFVLAVNLITNPYDKRPIASKLKDANITTKQWKNLLLVPKYLEFYQSHLDQIFDEQTQLDAKVGLQRLIANGDLAAIKHYQELQNIYRPQTNYNEVLSSVLTAIIEILTVHVSPNVLGIVANEISNVVNTTTAQTSSTPTGAVGSIGRAS
jgi:hypothetical protein